jgi:hypothetical protein
MAAASTGINRLWRYNYQVLIGSAYWILVLPVAASQVVTLWMFAMGGGFTQLAAIRIAELMMPALGAFLVAHSLAPEYKGTIGAVLASKPVSLHRVITLRAALAMLLAFLLTAVTLLVCSTLVQPVDVGRALLAGLPSLWYLSLLALLFATLFRNALGGFGVAIGIWAMDVALGYSVHPLLSVQGYAAVEDKEPLAVMWLVGKGCLLLAGLVFLLLHGRVLHRIYQAAERRDVLKMAGVTALVWLLYCVSGTAVMVGYAHTHRARLDRPDVPWLRRQLRVYGPVPVARFFGPAFAQYVAEPPAVKGGESPTRVRVRQLEQALQRWPNSIWADGIAYAIGLEGEPVDKGASVRAYFAVADRFGSSPFAPRALAQVLRINPPVDQAERMRAARRLVQDYPTRPEVETAAGALLDAYPAETQPEELITAANAAAKAGLRFRGPGWILTAAKAERDRGNRAEAAKVARQALNAAQALKEEDIRVGPAMSELRPHRARIDSVIAESEALLKELE